MMHSRRWLALPVSLALLASVVRSAPHPAKDTATGPTRQGGHTEVALPLVFEANHGQSAAGVKFLSRANGVTLFLGPSEATFFLAAPLSSSSPVPDRLAVSRVNADRASQAAPRTLHMKFAGANPAPIVGIEPLQGKVNYLIGRDPRAWRTNIPTFARVQYHNLYPGVDLSFYGNGGEFENDFVIRPGADPQAVALDFDADWQATLTPEGDLLLRAGRDQMRFRKPRAYQATSAGTVEVTADFRLEPGGRVRFTLGGYDSRKPLVIDPTLAYSSYLGGGAADSGNAVAVDGSGMVYVAGQTASVDFPTAGAYQPALKGAAGNAFIAKIDPTKLGPASLVYATFLGGSGGDVANGIAVEPTTGMAYVAGSTPAPDFPIVNGYSGTFGGGASDAFVAKLNAAGNTLLYSTYLGGAGDDVARGIAAGAAGLVYVTGTTTGTFPVTANAFQPSHGGTFPESFVAEIDTTKTASGSLPYSSNLGGTDGESDAFAIAADAAGHVYVTGRTAAMNFPVSFDAYQILHTVLVGTSTPYDAFVVKLDLTRSGSAGLLYGTYFGGSDNDTGYGIATEPSCTTTCDIFVAGGTSSTNFPTLNAKQLSRQALNQAWVARFDSLDNLIYSTYLGGDTANGTEDVAYAIAADAAGNAYVAGRTDSTNFPVLRPFQALPGGVSQVLLNNVLQFFPGAGPSDAFVSKFNPSGTLSYSSYLGGGGNDMGLGIALDGTSVPSAYVTGVTNSIDFPVANALQAQVRGGNDAFVAKILDGAPDFAIEDASGALVSKATVMRGQTASYGLQLIPSNGFLGTVTLACAGAPPDTPCLTPTSISMGNGGSPVSFTVHVTTTVAGGTQAFSAPRWLNDLPQGGPASLAAAVVLLLAMIALRRRIQPWRRSAAFAFAAFLLMAFALVSCGTTVSGTVPGPYVLTVNGTSGGVTRTMYLTLQVNQQTAPPVVP